MKLATILATAALLATMGCSNPSGARDDSARVSERDRDRDADRDRDRDRDTERSRDEDRGRDGDRGRDEDRSDEDRADSRRDDGGTRASSSRDDDRSAGDEELTEDWLIGSWADAPNCRNPIEFREGGVFVTHEGGRGTWSVENGDTVVFEANGNRRELRLSRVNANQVRVVPGPGGSWRCD